jgi:hypothetical protein
MPNAALATSEAIDTSRNGAATAKFARLPADARRLWRLVVALNVLGLMLFAVVLRCRDLGNLPGINGDEAWYGVQAELCLRGESIPWRTPSCNLLNPLFFGPQLAMHAIFGPSFVVLRATAVASGLLALLVNFWLCRRVFGRKIAVVSTVVLAVLPIDVACSRLAWDASQSLLATLPCIYLPLWAIVDDRVRVRCSVATLVALPLAVVVHPTNIFVAPIAVACMVYAWRAELLQIGRRIANRCRPRRHRIALIAALGTVTGVGLFAILASPELRRIWLWPAMARGVNPPQYAEFISNFGRLFSGAAVYEYLSGALRPPALPSAGAEGFRWDCLPYDAVAWLVGGWLVFGLKRANSRKRPEIVCLAIGCGAGLFGFFLVAGPGALAPGLQRYAIWTIGPTAILAAIAIGSWLARPGRMGRLAMFIAISLGWAFLLGFQTNCLDFLRQTGGRAHLAFRTAAVEPKQAALAYILAHCEPREPLRIVTSEWWIYWPMRYLTMGPRSLDANSRVTVKMQSDAKASAVPPASNDSQGERLWLVEFTDSPACQAIRQTARSSSVAPRETTIDDFSGQPLLSLFAVGRTNSNEIQSKEKN